MRLKSITAPDLRQAMARLRAALGDEAVIVATQELEGGGVRLTGAIETADLDLASVLTQSEPPPGLAWLAQIARHHELPDELLGRLEASLEGLADAEPLVALAQACQGVLRFAELPVATPLLLAGPAGGGKSASLAKLAARAVLDGQQVAVISADVARAGGLEQLTALLAPLALVPTPAADPTALKRAVGSLSADLVLIDSPGINPFRSADLGLLSRLIDASGAEVVLVLAAGKGVADCAEIGHTFTALGARHLLPTQLDAARRFGGLVAAAATGLALGEAGIGPTIGRGLGMLGARGFARLLLHAAERSAEPPSQLEGAA